MNTDQIRDIPIDDYLGVLGFYPSKTDGDSLWYHSPFRAEREASFKVSMSKNVWYDFGEGVGGDIFTFAGLYHSVTRFPDILSAIKADLGEDYVQKERKTVFCDSVLRVVRVMPVLCRSMVEYLNSRGITDPAVMSYCSAVYYYVRGREYSAVGFRNNSGGYELRNRYFKGCSSPKDITVIERKDSTACCVFEGFMDFLSYLSIGQKCIVAAECDFVVLNSVSNADRAVPFLREHNCVFCFLDNDAAGKKAYAVFESSGVSAVDMSHIYSPCKDINEYLCECILSKDSYGPGVRMGHTQ